MANSSDIEHIRHCMLYEFHRGNSATSATNNIIEMYGKVLDVRTCQRWFKHFREGDQSLKDLPIPGRSQELNPEDTLALVENNPHLTTRQMAVIFNCHHST